MKNKELKIKINKEIIGYLNGETNINDLVDFILKIDPKYIYDLLKNPKTIELGHVLDMIQEYDYYKKNGNKKLVLNTIKNYYEKKLKPSIEC